ncbi:MAG: hypothetical protein N3F64_00630 [Nitrososphaeria archaeon]|nr:hypothetical protein [Nitrososphaeria archaeon]
MKRKGQSASIAIVFIALMFISGYTIFYNQIEAFRQEFRLKEDILSRQVDRAKENIKIFYENNKIILYNDWTKFSEIKYIVFLNKSNFVENVVETKVILPPGGRENLQITWKSDKVGVITSLGNLFLKENEDVKEDIIPVGLYNGEGSITPVRLYINPENPKVFNVVVGLHYVYTYNITNCQLIAVRYVDAPRSLEDNPYRGWVYYMHPVIPFYDLSGWASWQMVSFTSGKVRTVYDTAYIFVYKFLCQSGGQKVESVTGTTTYSYYIQQVSTDGSRAWILMLSSTSGTGAQVFYSLVSPTSSNPGSANGLGVTLSGSSYASYGIVSFNYPYFIVYKYDSSTYYYYVYKISGGSAINKPWASGSSSSPYKSYSSPPSVIITRDGYYIERNGDSFTSYNMETGGYGDQVFWTAPYSVLGCKYTRYGLILLRWNGFDILNSRLQVVKSVNLPEGYNWYYTLQTYFSNFVREKTDYGYEYFEYQLSLIDSNTALAILSGPDGLAKIVKLTF